VVENSILTTRIPKMAPFVGLNNIAPEGPEPVVAILPDVPGTAEDSGEKDGRYVDSDSQDGKDVVPELAGKGVGLELSDLDFDDPDKIIKSGADAAQYMLSDRDDGDPAVTVRSMVIGTAFAAFYASISQIYKVSNLAP
jgi:hypothetical protein